MTSTVFSDATLARNSAASFPDQIMGLPCRVLSCAGGQVTVTQQGAQVVSWRDAQGRERFYLSAKTGGAKRGDVAGMATQAIRGGIPVSFPQFSTRGPLLKHGFIRLQQWDCVAEHKPDTSTDQQSEPASLTFSVTDDAQSRAIWAQAFEAVLKVELQENSLRTTLSITNRGSQAWEFTSALHSYLHVDDILKTELAGLQNTRYQDATANNKEVVEQSERLTIAGEIDRIYMSPPASLQLWEDGVPTLQIHHEGFSDTVVWNPGPELVRDLMDFPDADWRQMLCVEAACAATPVVLQAGETWSGTQTLTALSGSAHG